MNIREKLEQSIEQLPIPEGKTGVFIAAYENDVIRTAVATKINNTWSIQGDIGYHFVDNHKFEGKVEIKATW
jgi:hypothetical protein